MDIRASSTSIDFKQSPPPIEELRDTAKSYNLVAKCIKRCTIHKTAEELGGRKIVWKSRGEDSSWNRLLKVLSTNITKEVILPKDSRLGGCAKSIQLCVQDVLEHTLFTLVSEGMEDTELEDLDDDELMQLLITNLAKKGRVIFEGKGTPEQHFEAISEEILTAAFPERWNDPHLPDAVRTRGFKMAVGDPELLWKSTVGALATYGAELYDSLYEVNQVSSEEIEEVHPGITSLVRGILLKSRKLMTSEGLYKDLHLPLLDEYSSASITGCLPKILSPAQGEAESDQVLTDLHTWADAQIEHGLYAIFGTLLKTRPGQQAEDRRVEVFELLFSRAAEQQPMMKARRDEIDALDQEGVQSALRALYASLKDNPEAAGKSSTHYKKDIVKFMASQGSDEIAGKALLQKIASFDFSQSVFELTTQTEAGAEGISDFLDVNKKEFEVFFPGFFTFETALSHLYSMLGEYFLESEQQSEVIEQQAADAGKYLEGVEAGDELLTTIHELVSGYRKKTETLAKKRILEPTEYSLLNEIICQILAADSDRTVGCQLAKDLASRSIENVIIVSVADAIKRHQSEQKGGTGGVNESVASLAKALLKISQDGIESIQIELQDLESAAYSIDALTNRAAGLHIGISTRELAKLGDTERKEKYLDLELTALSQTLFRELLGEESFEALLPPVLKGRHVLESISVRLLPYLHEVYEKSHTEREENTTLKATLEVAPLVERIQNRTKMLIRSNEHLAAEPKQDAMLLHRILGSVSQQKEISTFAESKLDQVLEAAVAYHLNPKDGKSSDTRAVELLWSLGEEFEKIAALEVVAGDEMNFDTIQEEPFIKKYRRIKTLGIGEEFDSIDYFRWKIACSMYEKLVPAEILESFVSKKLTSIISNQIISTIKERVDAYHAYRVLLRKTNAQGKVSIETGGEGEGLSEDGQLIEDGIDRLLNRVKEGSVKTEDPWVNGVIAQIAATKNVAHKRLLTGLVHDIVNGLLVTAVVGGEDSPQKISLLLSKFDKEIVDEIESAFDSAEEVKYLELSSELFNRIYPGETWDNLVPPGLDSQLSKESLVKTLSNYLRDWQQVHHSLKDKSVEAKELLDGKPELEITQAYVDKFLVAPASEALKAKAQHPALLSPKLSPSFDQLAKEILGASRDHLSNIASARDRLVKQAIYTALHHVLSQEGDQADYIVKQLEELKGVYDIAGDSTDFLDRARKLLDIFLPDAIWKEVFEASGTELVSKDAMLPLIAGYLEEFAASYATLETRGNDAKRWLSVHKRGNDIQVGLANIMKKIDLRLDEYGNANGKIVKDQPQLVNDVIKKTIVSHDLAPAVRSVAENMVYTTAVNVAKRLDPGDPNSSYWSRESFPSAAMILALPSFGVEGGRGIVS
ncbi:hypothetical protein SCG7086_AO_00040 [Chlamydiales bacterium SCGC AG-110-P3]|nr:hypothetical protein SCG7086_AO_00040 [Chlamydiales bacterium SCGC AG-110-P3]